MLIFSPLFSLSPLPLRFSFFRLRQLSLDYCHFHCRHAAFRMPLFSFIAIADFRRFFRFSHFLSFAFRFRFRFSRFLLSIFFDYFAIAAFRCRFLSFAFSFDKI